MSIKTILKHYIKEIFDMSNVTASFTITQVNTDTTATITGVVYVDGSGVEQTQAIGADILAAITPKPGDMINILDDRKFNISTPESVDPSAPVPVPPATPTPVSADVAIQALLTGASIASVLSGTVYSNTLPGTTTITLAELEGTFTVVVAA